MILNTPIMLKCIEKHQNKKKFVERKWRERKTNFIPLLNESSLNAYLVNPRWYLVIKKLKKNAWKTLLFLFLDKFVWKKAINNSLANYSENSSFWYQNLYFFATKCVLRLLRWCFVFVFICGRRDFLFKVVYLEFF